ncbi:MAG: hypothetical protein QX194_00700 [Methylococcales bacterium]
MSEISIAGFSGMNNVKRDENFYSAEGVAEPRIILNADVSLTQSLISRAGTTRVTVISNPHSLWAGLSCMLCAAGGYLYRVDNAIATSVGAIDDRNTPVSFVEIEGLVYFSNQYCQGIFNPTTNTISVWGTLPPSGPMLLTGSGSLIPGTYNVTMTNVTGDEISGTGPITTIELTAVSGIQVINRPTGAIVWCTDANEFIFYRIGAVNQITAIPTVEPCPSLLCSPPPFLSNLCYAFGRIWGSSGKTVYYSQPFKFEWFRLSANRFEFESDITMIARVPSGLFIGMKDKTRFLEGTEPEKMQQTDAGAGSVQGTLAYCNNVPYLADILGTPEKGYVDVPIWVTTDGMVVGNAVGRLFNVTKNKLKFGTPECGASLYRSQNGVFQFLSSFKQGASGSGAGFSDEATCEVFRNGTLVPS